MSYSILTINPGSTSTKLGLFRDTQEVLTENISHSAEELAPYPTITDQLDYRLQKITEFFAAHQLSDSDFSAVVGRGGLLKPVISGTYQVNMAMLDDLKNSRFGEHASNLGAILAAGIAARANCPAFIVDPVVVDELAPVARLTGRPEINRRSIFHALNQKAVAKRFAKSINRPYPELNLIVTHLGGGISVGCHHQGLVVEVNNALDGDGPFTPERAGTLPAGQFGEMILDGRITRANIGRQLAGKAGLVAHLGTNDVRQVEARMADGDADATAVLDAMIYNIARHIGAAAIPVCGKVDHILLTGGIAHSRYLTEKLVKYVEFIAPVTILPGEDELQALAEGAYRVLSGEESAREYI
ncbi:MAG TPA: butyrate kinase [Patescibacteria group bacterium]|nr:butyrate kinase [Patescibacteria group bacterium]